MSDPKKEARLENGTWVDGNGKPLTNAELQAIRQDETIPGGRFVDERGFFVNANGEYIDESGKVVDEPVKAPEPQAQPTPQAQPELIRPHVDGIADVDTAGNVVESPRVARKSKTDR